MRPAQQFPIFTADIYSVRIHIQLVSVSKVVFSFSFQAEPFFASINNPRAHTYGQTADRHKSPGKVFGEPLLLILHNSFPPTTALGPCVIKFLAGQAPKKV